MCARSGSPEAPWPTRRRGFRRYHASPKALDGIGVHVAHHVDLSRVVNAPVLVARTLQPPVAAPLVGVDDRLRQHPLSICGMSDSAEASGTLLATTRPPRSTIPNTGVFLRSPRPGRPSGLALAALAAHIGLVRLDDTAERFVVVLGHRFVADKGEHPPRRLVGDAKLLLKLLCRDPEAGAGHQIHRV